MIITISIQLWLVWRLTGKNLFSCGEFGDSSVSPYESRGYFLLLFGWNLSFTPESNSDLIPSVKHRKR